MKKILLTFFICINILSGQSPQQEERLSQIDIYLHTVDVGDLVFNNFGHTAVRVHDKLTGQDLVYNWGVFDFGEPISFSLRFYRGDLLYSLGVSQTENAMRYYEYEERTVWEDKLNFNAQQKSYLLQKLEWNYLPENRQYQYQYFFNNCSTVVRDYFDEALGGIIKNTFSSKNADLTFRDTVRKAYSTNLEIQFPLEIIMNSDIDRKMTQWEHMFLPIELRKSLLALDVDGKKFVSGSKVLMDFESPIPYKLNSFQMLAIFIFTVLIVLLITIRRNHQITLIEKLLWLPCLAFTFFLGVLGFTLLINWFFAGHSDFHHNANLWLMWPTDILLFVLILKIIWKGKRFVLSNIAKSNWLLYIKAHWALCLLTTLLWLMGVINQNLSWTLFYFMPLLCLLLFAIQLKIKNCDVKV